MHGVPATRRKKLGFLRGVMAHSDVVALQEVHVNAEALKLELAPMLRERFLAMTAHDDPASGGTALLVRREALGEGVELVVEELHKGRALAVTAWRGASAVTVVSLHHFGMLAEMNRVSVRVRQLVDAAQRDPMNRLVVLAGDFNYDAPEEAPWRSTGGRGAHRIGPASLRAVVATMTELQQRHPTRRELAHGIVYSRIDRCYVSAPWWLLLAMMARVWAHSDLVALHRRGVSDHSPVLAHLLPRARVARGDRRLPHWVAHTPEYTQRLKAFEAAADLGAMQAWERLALQKSSILEVAQPRPSSRAARAGWHRTGMTERSSPWPGQWRRGIEDL